MQRPSKRPDFHQVMHGRRIGAPAYRRRRFRCGRGRPVDRWSQALFPGVPGDACMQRQQAGRQATGRPVPLHASIQPTGRAESADR